MQMKRFAFRSLLIAFLTLLLLECLTRIAGLDAIVQRRIFFGLEPKNPNGIFAVYQIDPDMIFRLRAGLSNLKINEQDNQVHFTVSTDSRGFRTQAGSAPEGGAARPILALGDSCTFGYGADDSGTYPARLGELMTGARGGKHQVVNSGVPGWTALQGRIFLERNIESLRPGLVVAGFGYNDCSVMAGLADSAVAERFALRPWERAFPFSALARTAHSLRVGSFLKAWATLERPAGSIDKTSPARLTRDEFREALSEICALCAQRRVPLVFVAWPMSLEVYTGMNPADDTLLGEKGPDYLAKYVAYKKTLREVAAAAGIPVVDPTEALKAAGKDDLYVDPFHLTADGYAIVAQAVLKTVLELRPAIP